MLKIAVLGANGQVGAELCLLLSRYPNIDLVPVSRNRSGSAFLRWCGISCRHGRVADSKDAQRLIGDCDLVVNSALANGTPREIRRIEDQLIENAFAYSKPGATVVHFSTQNVYGDPSPNARWRMRSPYGRAKLESERSVRRAARKWRKPAFILRLGHVTGELQNISSAIRHSIRRNSVVLPEKDVDSNTVFTATIVDAIVNISQGREIAGTYDLMNLPQWGWRAIYDYEANNCALALQPLFVPTCSSRSWVSGLQSAPLNALSNAAASTMMRYFAAKLLAHAPEHFSRRGQAWWYARRARREISAVRPTSVAPDYLSWVSNGRRFLRCLRPTVDLLAAKPYQNLIRPDRRPWPDDLPDFVALGAMSSTSALPSSRAAT